MSILTSNVVDSNMLIRCLVLSQEHFMSDRFFSGKINTFPDMRDRCLKGPSRRAEVVEVH